MSVTSILTTVWIFLNAIVHTHDALLWFYGKELADSTNNSWVTKGIRLYGRVDARFVTNDNLVASLHGLTFFVATPLCFLLLYCIWTDSVYRHSLQILLSVTHIFGGTLFFLGAYQQQFKTITKDPLLFWLMFVLINALWIVISILLLCQSIRHILSQTDKKKTE